MTSKPLASLVEELQISSADESRAELTLEACESIDANCVDVAERLLEAILTLAAEDPKKRRFKIGDDCFDKIGPDFKKLSPSQRVAVIKALCGELGDDAAAAWEHMADFQYGVSHYSMAYRSQSTPDANFDRLFVWFKEIVTVLYKFPPRLVTPEWISVYGGGIEDKKRKWMSGMLGVLGDGDSPQDAFGTLLGSVIAGGGDSSENVFETLSLIASGEHPIGVFDSYLWRALWRSGEYRCYEILLGLIAAIVDQANDENALVIGLIVQSARESGPVAMGIALESLLSHRLLMHKPVAMAIGSWIKIPLEEKPESERYEIVRQLLASLQNLEQLKNDLGSEISGRDAGLLLFAQAYEDAADVPKLAGQLFPRVLPAGKSEFAAALAQIETPPEVEPNSDVWLSLLMEEDSTISVPIVLYSTRPANCDPEKLWMALEKFESHLPSENQIGTPMIAGDDQSTHQDAYKKMTDFACGIADGMPPEKLLKILKWSVCAGYGWNTPEPLKSQIEAIDLSDANARKIFLETLRENSNFAYLLIPRLVQAGVDDSDREWLAPLLMDRAQSKSVKDALLRLPTQQQHSLLVEPLLADEDAENRLAGCRFLHWFCETENPPDWIAQTAEKMLSDPLKEVRASALGVFGKLVQKGQSQKMIANAILQHSQKKKLSSSDKGHVAFIQAKLPKELRKKTQVHTVKHVSRSFKAIRKMTLSFGRNTAQEADFIEAWQDAIVGDYSIRQCTSTKFRFLADHPAGPRRAEYQQMVDRYVQQTTDILLAKKSAATEDAIKIGTKIWSIRGIDNLFKLLKAIGKKKFKRINFGEKTKVFDLLCQLITVSIPSPGETFAAFSDMVADALKAKWLTRERLIELSVYAPQWAGWIENALDVPGLKDAALWFNFANHRMAVFMEFNLTIISSDPTQFPSIAKAQPKNYDEQWLAKRSQLGRRQDVETDYQWHIDADWFFRAKAGVDPEIWTQLVDTVPLLRTPKVCVRFQNIIAALSGETEVADLKKRIETEEPGVDAVQLVALIPVADITDGSARLLDLANRVRLFQLHARLARKLKVAKRKTAMSANESARTILATVAGIKDPDRLDWYAMSDLNERIDAVSPVTIDNATLSLALQPNGQPVVFIETDGKTRKTIPKAIAKNDDAVRLKALLKELKSDAKQVLKSFELAMINEVSFGAAEIINFLNNPLIGPPLKSLTLSNGGNFGIAEVVDGKLYLFDATGEQTEVAADGELSITHAMDLLSADCLANWREFFNDRIQAVDQVHREIFKPTQQELADGRITRFAEFKIRENQARAIFQGMQWRADKSFGPCWFAKSGPDGTLASVHLEPTGTVNAGESHVGVTEIDFFKERKISIDEVNPKFLSETIRQVNQVVSVAGTE